jgi:Domain of unknown function (DUF4864)
MQPGVDKTLTCRSEQSEESNGISARGRRRGFFALLRTTSAGIWFLFGLLMAAGAAEPQMRLSPKKIRDEVHATVETQLNALREGNFEAAYELASAGIRAQFDLRLYAALIRHGYPVLLQANEADLGIVRDRNEEVAQVTVSMLDRQKRTIVYSYWLVKEEAGWRINGVVLEQKPPRGDI